MGKTQVKLTAIWTATFEKQFDIAETNFFKGMGAFQKSLE